MPGVETTIDAMVGNVRTLARSWERSLRATNRSPKTRETYLEATGQLADFLEARGMPTAVAAPTREHVETFVEHLVEHRSPATASNRYRALVRFFSFLEEGEVAISPMARMKPPSVPEVPIPVLADEDLRRLLQACPGREFDDRRDTAVLRLFIDTGMRLSELANLKVDDLDLDHDVAQVLGKGRRPRACPFGSKTSQSLDRYVRLRSRHTQSSLPWLWLGRTGRMTPSGVGQMVGRRGNEAGIPGLHPHILRHVFAHRWLAGGGNEGDLMRLAG